MVSLGKAFQNNCSARAEVVQLLLSIIVVDGAKVVHHCLRQAFNLSWRLFFEFYFVRLVFTLVEVKVENKKHTVVSVFEMTLVAFCYSRHL